MGFDINKCIRPNIIALQPYRCARDDYQSGILLDANENSYGPAIAHATENNSSHTNGSSASPTTDQLGNLHRYPDPHQHELKDQIAKFRGVSGNEKIFLGVGSDEVIDMLIRITCVPGQDKILITPPTYGMYGVAAQINDVEVVRANLRIDDELCPTAKEGRFDLVVDAIEGALKENPTIKLVFLCSPGNPTGKLISKSDIEKVLGLSSLQNNNAIVVVDEAYIDFSPQGSSAIEILNKTNALNLIVSQTLSKSFGLASIRLGIAFGHPSIIHHMNCAKAPYNISLPTSQLAMKALEPSAINKMQSIVNHLAQNRQDLIAALTTLSTQLPSIGRIISGDHANFILVQICSNGQPDNVLAQRIYETLAELNGVVVRFRGKEDGCKGCLRISIGTVEENKILLDRLTSVLKSM